MKCEFCTVNIAKKCCINCPINLNACDECFAQNHKYESNNDHIFELPPSSLPQSFQYDLCSKHNSNPCIYFCIDCQLLLCNVCMIYDDHFNHKKISSNYNKIIKMLY